MKTALIVIASGADYRNYALNLIQSAEEFLFPHDIVLFTDGWVRFGSTSGMIQQIPMETMGFPEATMMRYHVISKAKEVLSRYDFLCYADADMEFVSSVEEEEVFSQGITATLHPGYAGMRGPTEKNPNSACYLINNKHYFCGGFDGGTSTVYLQMAEELKGMIDHDLALGIVPIWHDESCKNRYLADNPPAKILSPAFCYPENASVYYKHIWEKAGLKNIEPKLVALTKHGIKR